MTSTPVYMIEVGDLIPFGYGTANPSYSAVTEITELMTNNGNRFTFFMDNGYKIYRFNGDWAEVTKGTPEGQRRADAVATAYANAWDNKR